MPMKKYKPQQIVTLLRQIEVEIANEKNPVRFDTQGQGIFKD